MRDKELERLKDKKRAGTPKRIASHLKACRNYRKNHPDNDKNYYDKNKNRILGQSKEYFRNVKMQKLYGLTAEAYNQLLLKQDNRCLICGNHFTIGASRACVDHDHDTRKVRGLLCHRCNSALGLFKESVTILNNALKYLEDHKCKA